MLFPTTTNPSFLQYETYQQAQEKYLELNDPWVKSLPTRNRLSEMLYASVHFFTDEYSG
jgi:hypothetical protein